MQKTLYRKWTFQEELTLLLYWQGTKNVSLIANRLNISEKRVLDKAYQLKLGGTNNKKWTEKECQYLELIAETATLEEIVKRYNLNAKHSGWYLRTKDSIRNKIQELGYTQKPIIGYVHLSAFAKYIGRSYNYVKKLVDEKKIVVCSTNKFIFISEKDIIEFAKKYPYDMAEKMTKEGVIWFLQIINDNDVKSA